jgi:hypothetical protein
MQILEELRARTFPLVVDLDRYDGHDRLTVTLYDDAIAPGGYSLEDAAKGTASFKGTNTLLHDCPPRGYPEQV